MVAVQLAAPASNAEFDKFARRVLQCGTAVRLPDLRFSEYFIDQNHQHNLDDEDVIDAVVGRTVVVSGPYNRNGKRRRKILAKTDSDYITIICEEAEDFWWVISAFPSSNAETARAKSARVGRE